ncbi:MAG: hypothetical protein ACRCY8_20120, partial [Dermatophilaceae bacterium]
AASVAGALLAPRIGTKVVVTTGLVLFGGSFLWVATLSADSSYATQIVPQMVIMGLGMGLISTPATESILLVLPPARAGVGSAVNDATRELGGTLGVAVVGSVFSSVYGAALASGAFGAVDSGLLARAEESVGVARGIATAQPALETAFRDAFMSGLQSASLMVGAVCLAGAVVAVFTLPGRLTPMPDDDAAPDDGAVPDDATVGSAPDGAAAVTSAPAVVGA